MPATVSGKRYAQAVFQIALEKNALEKWQPDLRRIVEITQDSELMSLLEHPRLPFEVKAKLTQGRLGGVNPLALNLACLLLAKGRLKSANQIADEYDRLLDNYRGIRHAEVITAVPLDDTSGEKVRQGLENVIGERVSISLQVDPSILGGFIARIDDCLIDCSIRNKLWQLRRSLVETGK